MTKRKNPSNIDLRKQMFPGLGNGKPKEEKEAKETIIKNGSFKKIQVRISLENFEWLESEAQRTGSNLSAVAGLLLADGIIEKKIRLQRLMDEIEKTNYYREASLEK